MKQCSIKHYSLRLPMDEAGISDHDISSLKDHSRKSGLPLDRLIIQILKRYIINTQITRDLTIKMEVDVEQTL